MRQTVSIKDTRENLAELVNRVAIARQEFVLTKFGKPQAMLVPIPATESTKTNLDEVFAAWKNKKGLTNTTKWVRDIRTKMSTRTNE